MKTELIKINNSNRKEILKKASSILKTGGLVVFPTETVYGLGAVINNDNAIKKIYKAKGRPSDNPLIVHIAKKTDLKLVTETIGIIEKKLIENFWPGPLTIIFEKRKEISKIVSGGLNTIAIRMPKNKTALELIKLTGIPIAAPSANSSGRPSGTTGIDIYNDLNKKVHMIIDDGYSHVGIESTVVKIENNNIYILRPGAVTIEMITKILPNTNIVHNNNKEKSKSSPGTKYKHYSPKHRLDLVIGSPSKIGKKMKKYAETYEKLNKKIGIIYSEENEYLFSKYIRFNLGSNKKLEIISKNIYKALRFFDEKDVDIIICESFIKRGMGFAIMDRLKRASTKMIY